MQAVVTYRASKERAEGAVMVAPPSKTSHAATKSRPCLARFFNRLSSSHSNIKSTRFVHTLQGYDALSLASHRSLTSQTSTAPQICVRRVLESQPLSALRKSHCI